MNTQTTHTKQEFRGDKKDLIHFLVPYEKKFIESALPHIPPQVTTAHLTLMTILWSSGIIVSGYLAHVQGNLNWLWVFSGCIFMQYVTDMLDGAVGRARNTGLIKWGFYMDHFLDYVFLASIVAGYSFLLPLSYMPWVVACLGITAGFMVHVLMDFAITNNFKISCNYFGVSEVRWMLIVFNVFVVIFGQNLLVQVFPFFVGVSFIALCTLVYKCQKIYSHLDAIHQSIEVAKTSKES